MSKTVGIGAIFLLLVAAACGGEEAPTATPEVAPPAAEEDGATAPRRRAVRGVSPKFDVGLISVTFAQQQATEGSENPSVSADGRFVAFVSSAPNLVADDANGT